MRNLDATTWQRLSPLLDRALDLDPADRGDLLRQLRDEQPDIAALLVDLLAEHDALQEDGFLESPAMANAGHSLALAGTTVGAYTLESPLGAGGMGSVWRARRSDGRFDGAVAVKLLHLTVLDGGGAARFTREGTALARLSHPHIARLLDAGVAPTGQPYLILELIDGARIDDYADDTRLDIRARLDLFVQAASAVSHAHTHLIVHRDLKPANILVDAARQVKLLDFGIAKLLDDPDGESAHATRTGNRPWTPAYASPEQVRGEPVTTATDVYALGVLLYHLLVDAHPTSSAGATTAEHLKGIVDVEPIPPSAAMASLAAADAVRVASARATTPDTLRRTLSGDLDNIVAMALRKAPERRYASVAAFADDLQRYLRDEPIVARPDRWSYRAHKFVRRHRVSVIAVTAMVTTLAAATIVTTDRLIEARRQRDEAEFQARRASASSDFMRNLVTQIGSTPMTMRQVLDRGRQALEQQYAHDPAFVARMLSLLSGPYFELGDNDTASAMTARALELAKQVDDVALQAGSHCSLANDAAVARQLPAAHTHLEEARRQIARLVAPSTGLLLECAYAESQLAGAERRLDDAIGHAKRAVALIEADDDTSSTRYATALSNLATVSFQAGRSLDALQAQRKQADVTRRIGRGRTTSMVVSLHNQCAFGRTLGWWRDAERTCLDAIVLARGIDKAGEVPGYLAQNYARVLIAMGRRAEGREWLQRTLEHTAAAPRFVTQARLMLASVSIDEGDLAGAREAFVRAERELGGSLSSADRVATTIVRARLAVADGARDRARAAIDAALAAEGYPAQLSPFVHELLEYGARLALQAGDATAAERFARDAIAACERHFGTDVPSAHAGRAHLTHGLALFAAGRPTEARVALARAETLLTAAAGRDHHWIQEAHASLASLGR